MIYVNAFPRSFVEENPPLDWKKDAIRICDGGPSLFGVVYDVRERKFSDVHFNGAV